MLAHPFDSFWSKRLIGMQVSRGIAHIADPPCGPTTTSRKVGRQECASIVGTYIIRHEAITASADQQGMYMLMRIMDIIPGGQIHV